MATHGITDGMKSRHKLKIKSSYSSRSDLSPPRVNKVKRDDDKDIAKLEHKGTNFSRKQSPTHPSRGKMSVERTKFRNEPYKSNQIEDEALGKGARTVFRDRKRGTIRNLKEEIREEKAKKAKEDELAEKYKEWGKGLKQQDDKRKQIEEELYEMSKPLARYEGDEDLEKHLKEQEREGDPMLEFVRKKKLEGKPTRPTYKGPAPPPNRYNIMPGHKWDGVDRSNGFEKKCFERQSNRIAAREEAYKWSIENM